MSKIFVLLILYTATLQAKGVKALYKKVFPGISIIKAFEVKDTISDNPINNQILKVYNNEGLVGFIREINSSTGCNSACLPVIYTSFYDSKGGFKKILSKDGLTKINHTPFSDEDYSNLDFIVSMEPEKFNEVSHPKEMTDAISGATLKKYQDVVVKGAAYTTLRVHLYNLNTQNLIKKHLNKTN